MPPPTSPTQPSRSLTPLSYLSSPVPDFASTLTTTEAAERAEEANVSFLRDSLDLLEREEIGGGASGSRGTASRTWVEAHRDPRRRALARPASGSAAGFAAQGAETAEDLSRRERLQRVLARLNRLQDPPATAGTVPSTITTTTTAPGYGNRTPSPHRQNLYDWAPGAQAESERQEREMDAILAELRQGQPGLGPAGSSSRASLRGSGDDSRVRREGNGTPAPGLTAVEAAERRDRLRDRERRRRETEWVSLRARAAIQRSRQEGSPSATERMLRYVMERERSGVSEEEDRARAAGWFPSRAAATTANEAPTSRAATSTAFVSNETRDQARQERIEAFRRGYLAESVPPRLPRISTPPPLHTVASPSSPTLTMEDVMRYLDKLRDIPSVVDTDPQEMAARQTSALDLAIDHGLATPELWADQHHDFVMDLDALGPIPESSWLQPGATFDGLQYASGPSMAHEPRSRSTSNNVTHVLEQINSNVSSRGSGISFDHPPGSTHVAPFDATRPWLSHTPVLPTLSFHPATGPLPNKPLVNSPWDHWPVRVILHTIDWDRMTLQGTMEAYDVPQTISTSSLLGIASNSRPKIGRKTTPIVTYLEGQIIDLTTHSFLTPDSTSSSSSAEDKPRSSLAGGAGGSNGSGLSTTQPLTFPRTTPATDAKNWSRLPPFNSNDPEGGKADEESSLPRLLLSSSGLAELQQKYIFARLKERCFVHLPSHNNPPCPSSPQSRTSDRETGHGLTISGFYYISICRVDGGVEGVYFDPGATGFGSVGVGAGGFGAAMAAPVQYLRMRPRGGEAAGGREGVWGFR
ncbi:hypothetical protein LTR62_001088 [Meristemomyces frigidus]|uniref:Uncharacterized protein n=1 Tax=Meristemomyces frigidus TaxID=1508187 RepID=A0AAN7T9J4_9PEZI|nr:hypothetical protein LTR62_001088 [Meristemomyces frigidus]